MNEPGPLADRPVQVTVTSAPSGRVRPLVIEELKVPGVPAWCTRRPRAVEGQR